jgi:hypothetical protein
MSQSLKSILNCRVWTSCRYSWSWRLAAGTHLARPAELLVDWQSQQAAGSTFLNTEWQGSIVSTYFDTRWKRQHSGSFSKRRPGAPIEANVARRIGLCARRGRALTPDGVEGRPMLSLKPAGSDCIRIWMKTRTTRMRACRALPSGPNGHLVTKREPEMRSCGDGDFQGPRAAQKIAESGGL